MNRYIQHVLKVGASVVLVLFAVGCLFLLMTGCATKDSTKVISSDCDFVCKECKDVKLKCEHGATGKKDVMVPVL